MITVRPRRAGNRRIIGLMSGTSMDGIDAALVSISGSGTSTRFRLEEFITVPYPRNFRAFLLGQCSVPSGNVTDLMRADMLVAMFFADAVRRLIRKSGLAPGAVEAIGSHGQTIGHLPARKQMFGKGVRATMQIGNPSAIAKFTGIPTVGDFRTGDVAAGGIGAPLVPLFDYLTLRSRTKNRGALNIGGIANITVLPRNCTRSAVMAFDTGPGNMVIDALMQKYFRRPYDRGGATAGRGMIIPDLLRWMSRHPFLAERPPKSTGREAFGAAFAAEVARRAHGERPENVITTATEFTALSISTQYQRWIRPATPLAEVIVSGGGVHNLYLMDALRRYFEGVRITTSAQAHIPPDAKEAVCFALLANEALHGHPGNLPSVTGARRETVLGVIALP